jgi:long-chain acyl-CoA synthetase
VSWALGIGREASERRQAGQALGPRLAAQHALADRLVFSKVKARLGGKMRVVVSGGAPLAPEIARFFHSLDILILEGYGLTECTTVATFNRPDSFRFGTVGRAMPDVEVTVTDDGEVLVRGETVFAGYWANETATAAVLDENGWLRTGDLGWLDAAGFLTISGRIKDIIVTSEGKNISPANIENALKASPYVAEALVVGDNRPHLAALIDTNAEEVAKVAPTDEEARALIGQVVTEVNRRLGKEEQLVRFRILPRSFAAEAGELTPTLKLKRNVCEEHFHDLIEELYATARGSARPHPERP